MSKLHSDWIKFTLSGVVDTVFGQLATPGGLLRRLVVEGLAARDVSVKQVQTLGHENSAFEVAMNEFFLAKTKRGVKIICP